MASEDAGEETPPAPPLTVEDILSTPTNPLAGPKYSDLRRRSAPGAASLVPRARFAVASCQHYEHGFYTAYRHMLGEDIDLRTGLWVELAIAQEIVRIYTENDDGLQMRILVTRFPWQCNGSTILCAIRQTLLCWNAWPPVRRSKEYDHD